MSLRQKTAFYDEDGVVKKNPGDKSSIAQRFRGRLFCFMPGS